MRSPTVSCSEGRGADGAGLFLSCLQDRAAGAEQVGRRPTPRARPPVLKETALMFDPSGGAPVPAPDLRPDWAAIRPASWRTKLLYAGPLALMVAPFLPWVRAQIFIATF